MKHLNIPVDDETHEQLKKIKGNRSWHDAVVEEFGIDE
jgi:predicted CopG family antitoxin